MEPLTVGEYIMRATRLFIHACLDMKLIFHHSNYFRSGVQNHPYHKKKDHLGSDLSYHFLEAEANSADSMVKQFNYLSMLNCIRWWSSTCLQDIHNPPNRITKGEMRKKLADEWITCMENFRHWWRKHGDLVPCWPIAHTYYLLTFHLKFWYQNLKQTGSTLKVTR